MDNLSVFISALEKVRYQSLDCNYHLSDFVAGTPAYDLLCVINNASNELSSIIETMSLVSKRIGHDSGSCK